MNKLQQLIDKADRATPGRWFVRKVKMKSVDVLPELRTALAVVGGDQDICDFYEHEGYGLESFDNDIANAAFIAAASPTVVKALVEVVDACETFANGDGLTMGDIRKRLAHLNDVLKERDSG